jgi:hypothetical protein
MPNKPTTSRRKFLATLGIGGAAAAAATVALTRKDAEPAAKGATVSPQGKGYQVTEHVRNYYRTAKV